MSQGARTKVVVRLLPPFLTEDGFKETIGAWLDATNWFTYYKGKSNALEVRHSCAYLNFIDPSDVIRFKCAFDKHVFVSDKGAQYRCSVVYAPNQRLARGRGLRDSKEGTVEKDAEYKEFLAGLESGTGIISTSGGGGGGGQRVAEERLSQGAPINTVPVETALMAYLKGKRAAMKKLSSSEMKKSKKKDIKANAKSKVHAQAKSKQNLQASDSTTTQQRAGSLLKSDKKFKDSQKKSTEKGIDKKAVPEVAPRQVLERRKSSSASNNNRKKEGKPLVQAESKVVKILRRPSNEVTGVDVEAPISAVPKSHSPQTTIVKPATKRDADEKTKRGEGKRVASQEQRGEGRGGRQGGRGRGRGRGRASSGPKRNPGSEPSGSETNVPTVILRPPPGLRKRTAEN